MDNKSISETRAGSVVSGCVQKKQGGMRMRKRGSFWKKAIACLLASAVAIGTAIPMNGSWTVFAAEEGQDAQRVTFAPAPAGHVYEGMPLFDGDPGHYESYLDAVIDYIGLEGAARFAFDTRGDYVLTEGKNAGKKIPGSLTFTDCVQGVSTDFPAIIGLGQSWNKELVKAVGNVLGNERVNKVDYSNLSNINVMACTATSDLRINPLSGRFDEGFAEDPYLAATMVDEMATGVSGIQESGANGFWQKAVVTTKHFTTYNAQMLRTSASNNASARALLEYQPQSALKGFESGAVSGFMSSYGRTNGLPNIISPLINFAKSRAPYGVFSVTDNGSVSSQSTYGNGFDSSYVPVIDDSEYSGQGYSAVGSLMAMANSSGASTTRNGDRSFWTLVNQVRAGTYGVTEEDVENVARDQIGQLVRCGVLNADMNQYPFYGQSAGQGVTDDYNNANNQAVALQAAQESVVMLKNENHVLPLDKNDSVYVSGPMSVTRFKTTYAVSQSPQIENALYSTAAGIQAIGGKDHVSYSVDGQVVNIKTSGGKYIALAEDGVSLVAVDDKEAAAKFEKYSWGQQGYTYKCVDNGKWMRGVVTGGGWFGGGEVTAVEASGEETLEQISNSLEATYVTTTMPYRFRVESNEDGTLSYVLESYSESFMGTAPIQGYYQNGRYVKVGEDGKVSFTEKLTNKDTAAALRTAEARFTEEVVADYGADTAASDSDYAVVVVGAPTRHSSGEGCDRTDLHLGDGQYAQVANVAAAYPGKTIVVVQTNYPEIIQEFKDNPNVAAILVQPYAGQYGGYALGQILYGDAAPTGKLTATWYNTNDVLPAINGYSIPEGTNLTLNDLDPRFTTDMTNADPAQTRLTYLYANPENVTYAFGAGLTYSEFAYSNLRMPSSISGDQESFEVSVDVQNTGSRDASEVVQLYMANANSAYGVYAPQTKLVSFEKVAIPAGQSKTVTLKVDMDDFALWNTNTSSYIVEAGTYQVNVGSSSADIRQSGSLAVTGESIGALDASSAPVNVFDSSYASSEVVYREVSKAHTAEALAKASRDSMENAAHNVAGGYYAVMGKQDGAWAAMKSVDLENVVSIKARVASRNEHSSIEVRADGAEGALLGTLDFHITPVNSYNAPETGKDPDAAIDLAVQELDYAMVEVKLDQKLQGVHDVYVVFKTPNARIDTIQFEKAVKEPADMSALTALVEKVKRVDGEAYTAESYEKLAQALEAANAVLANKEAEQGEVDQAADLLTDALTALQPKEKPTDWSVLSSLAEKIKKVDREAFTEESYAKLAQALETADAVLQKKEAKQEEVDQAVNLLADALTALQPKKEAAGPDKDPEPKPEPANLKSLTAAIQKAKAANRNKYAKDSLAKMDALLQIAESMSQSAPQKELQAVVNDVTRLLNQAVKKLDLKKGQTAKVGKLSYKITSVENKTVAVTKPVKKTNTAITIPAAVKINGYTYKVTSIASKAFQNNKKLKKITVKSTKITKVGKNALKGIYKKAVVKVPASKLAAYKKLFAKKGQAKTVKIKK